MKYPLSKVARYALDNPSSIREIMSVVTDYRLHPEKYPRKLVYLGGGWPQDPPPPTIIEAATEVVEDESAFNVACRYGTTRGQPPLIRGLVEYEKQIFGRKVSPDEILVGSGSTDLIGATVIASLDPGSEVIVTKPAYLNYIRQLQVEMKLDVKIKCWPIIRDGEFNPSLEDLKEVVSSNTRMIILTSPGNPDSRVIRDEILEGVVDIAEEKNCWVIIDVAYRAFFYKEVPKYMSRERRENEIWMCTLSKEFRIPGWRLAYIISDPDFLRAVEVVEQARVLCPNRFVQEIMTRVLLDEDRLKRTKEYFEKQNKIYAKVAMKTAKMLREEIPLLKVLEPEAGFYVFFNHEAYEPSSRKVCNDLLRDWQVALAPGVDFLMDGWTRLSFAPCVLNPEALEEGVQRMKMYFESLAGKAK
ncbi:MAG: hypothetical protein DRJ26_03565 [Candidatus Methanomethylicota archaeon]|uniref:Aminotransferase class I/classII large domain-containing protein n=1 Tax=Thermoproteota archaeon TaxID=2056631 RepID=A0A497F1E1_9CREN|nr:MAG: hypothetical protein DRJ26_03565 [Candidatus Verstraetearchaeota archaeon]